jgi:hypothetical protein
MNFLAFALIIFGLTQIEIAKIDYHAQCTSDSGCSATQYCIKGLLLSKFR